MKKKAVSEIMLMLLLLSMLTLAFNIRPVNASGTIYIRPDGSVEPQTAPIERVGDLYTLTSNINGSIVVEKDGILIDGDGCVLQSDAESFIGVDLTDRKDVTIIKLIVKGFHYGIWFYDSYHNTLLNNSFAENMNGIWFSQFAHSGSNEICDNAFINNTGSAIFLTCSESNFIVNNYFEGNRDGIEILYSTGNVLRYNSMENNEYGFWVGGVFLDHFINDVDVTNRVNNKPIYYWINRRDETVPFDAGLVIIVNSTNIRVENLALSDNTAGITFAFTENSLIKNVAVTDTEFGICLHRSDRNTIVNNCASNNSNCGISLDRSHHNLIANNIAMNNVGDGVVAAAGGIYLEDTEGNILRNNLLVNNSQGIGLDDSYGIEVIRNDIIGSYQKGIMIANLHNGVIAGNNIISNNEGVWIALTYVMSSRIYHNNFINNSRQTRMHMIVGDGSFQWDDGYPSGGNYWSDYLGWDADNDGIGDQPYVIDEDMQDHYPLMSPYGSPPLPMITLTVAATDGGTTDPAPGNYTHSETQNIIVNATPSDGYLFDHWELDSVNIGASNPVNVIMDADHTLRAVFTLAYTLTITTGTGGTTNPTSGTYTHSTGTAVTVTATPNTGYYFDHWELDGVNCSNNPVTVAMNMTHTLKALFARLRYILSITATDGGTTDPTPDFYTHWWGTIISVSALPDTGYYLDHWELNSFDIGIHDSVNVTMNANHTLHAVYRQLSSGHDVAIKGVTSRTVVGQGYPLIIKVTAANIGSYAETFNVTVYANADPIASRSITIESGAATTIAFTWNTSGLAKGNHTISAVADTVPGETNTTDNILTDGWVIVAMVGDITGPEGYPDGKCDIKDVAVVARLYGVNYPDPRYDPNCDLTGPTLGVADGKIDIKDVALVAKYYGEIDP